jgi:hypothetical protein
LNELDFFLKIIVPIFSGFGIVSLIWNIYNFYQAQKGFLKLKLECSSEHDPAGEKYIICKTSVENTGRTKIRIQEAFLDTPSGERFQEDLTYYKDPKYNLRLGSLENASYTFIRPVTQAGAYEIEFRVVGKPYFGDKKTIKDKVKDFILRHLLRYKEDYITYNRTVKDSVIVKSAPEKHF